MKEKLRLMIFGVTLIASAFLAGCGDEDGICAGCDSDAPWSAYGSGRCYYEQDDCELREKNTCTVCD